MIILRKFTGTDSCLEIVLNVPFAVIDLLPVCLHHIILKLLVHCFWTRIICHIHRFLKKHAGDRGEDCHQKDNDNDKPFNERLH